MHYSALKKLTEHCKLLHPSQVPVWGYPGQDKLKQKGVGLSQDKPAVRPSARRQQPLERRPQLTRTIHPDPPKERANMVVRSRVLDLPQSDKKGS